MKVKSDGKASTYYDFPEGSSTLNDLIEYKNMSFAQGNIFKAAYRLGNKEGISLEYDLNKIIYYAERMLNKLKEKDKPHVDTDWRSDYTTGPRGDSVGQGTLPNKRVLPVCAT